MDHNLFDLAVMATASSVLGAMLFFAAVVAPSVFKALPAEQAGLFLRALFPRYYLVLGAVTFGAALVAAYADSWWSAAVLAACAIIFLLGRFVVVPLINAYRDKMLEGDDASRKRFEALHRCTVIANFAQMIGFVYVIAQAG